MARSFPPRWPPTSPTLSRSSPTPILARQPLKFVASRAARLQVVKSDITRNLGDYGLSVAAIAARHGVTPRYIHKLFESEGRTFSEYVLDRRLSAAHRLLTNRRLADRSIASVAYDCGFGDLSYFNRTFRRRYNATPTEVRSSGELRSK